MSDNINNSSSFDDNDLPPESPLLVRQYGEIKENGSKSGNSNPFSQVKLSGCKPLFFDELRRDDEPPAGCGWAVPVSVRG